MNSKKYKQKENLIKKEIKVKQLKTIEEFQKTEESLNEKG